MISNMFFFKNNNNNNEKKNKQKKNEKKTRTAQAVISEAFCNYKISTFAGRRLFMYY